MHPIVEYLAYLTYYAYSEPIINNYNIILDVP